MPVMLLIVVLTCGSGTPHGDCNRDTALDVRVVGRTPMPTACALGGMQVAAREASEPGRHYCMVRCERS